MCWRAFCLNALPPRSMSTTLVLSSSASDDIGPPAGAVGPDVDSAGLRAANPPRDRVMRRGVEGAPSAGLVGRGPRRSVVGEPQVLDVAEIDVGNERRRIARQLPVDLDLPVAALVLLVEWTLCPSFSTSVSSLSSSSQSSSS